MSVRINLLPREVEEKSRQRRQIALAGLVVLLFVAGLALLLVTKQASVDDAAQRRDDAQASVNQVQAQVNALVAFQGLANELAAGDELIATAMGEELAVARLLNDVALSLPNTSSLRTLTLDRALGTATAGTVDLGDNIATLLLTGYSIERFAPGVESVLLRFDEIEGLVVTYLNAATEEEIVEVEVTSFDASSRLNDDILTQRYVDGLPEVGS